MINRASRSTALIFVLVISVVWGACSSSQKNDDSAPASSGPPAYEGYHDFSACDGIIGWAWDSNRPNEPVRVEIYDGETLLATVPADQFRQDLVGAKKGNGKHGFTYAIPPRLKDGKPHSIRVKYSGTSVDLYNTPKDLDCVFQQP